MELGGRDEGEWTHVVGTYCVVHMSAMEAATAMDHSSVCEEEGEWENREQSFSNRQSYSNECVQKLIFKTGLYYLFLARLAHQSNGNRVERGGESRDYGCH